MSQSGSLTDRLTKLVSPGMSGSDVRVTKTPEAWRSISDVDDTAGGYLISKPRKEDQDENLEEIFNDFKLDQSKWIVTSLRRSRWQTFSGEWLEATRINVLPAGVMRTTELDLEKMIDEIKKWRPRKQGKTYIDDLAYVFAGSDQQLGKSGSGQGTEHTVDRLYRGTELGLYRLEELRKIGRGIDTCVLPQLGDHVEGNVSQGGRLQSHYASDLGLPQQIRVGVRILTAQVKAFSEVSRRVIVPIINGNHDEVTRQVSVDPADGWNTFIGSMVQDICAENPNLAHVEFRYPETDHQTLAIDIKGTMLGLFHGHQMKAGDPVKYLSGQAAGQTALGGCDVWLSGHFHHFKSADIGPRFWAQCPTVDPGSAWFRDRTGLESQAGVLTLVVGEGYDPRKDMSVLSLPR